MKYRPEIDGLRAVAVLPVIFFHADFAGFSGGFVGVDVFFVISGYLITTIIATELAQHQFSLLNFYERRARRILPALFFVSLACLPFAWFWLAPRDLKDFGQSLVAVSTFSSNVLFWRETGYFDAAAELKPLLHTWSLAVEEQYYVLFPLLMMVMWRFGLKRLVVVLGLVFVASLSVAHVGAAKGSSAAFYLLPTRMWELLVGVFAALYLQRNPHPSSLRTNQAMSALGLAMIVYSVIAFGQDTPFPGAYALVPTLGTGLLVLSAVPGTLTHALLSLRPLVAIGLCSYSAYLWHQPLLAFAHHRLIGQPSPALLFSLCVVALLLAYTSWRWVEAPFRNKQRMSRGTIFGFSAIGILFFTAIGAASHVRDGFPERLESPLDFATVASSPMRTRCHSRLEPCEYFGETVNWATFGDSHAVELSYALAQALQPQNIGVQHNSYTECAPSLGQPVDGCTEWSVATTQRLMADDEIRHIVVAYRLTLHLFGESLGHYPTLVDDKTADTRAETWANLVTIIEGFVDSGKNVYLVIQPPELPAFVEKSILWHGASTARVKGVERLWWTQRNAFVTERLDELPESVRLIDTTDTFCDAQWCYASDAGGFLYFDDDHVSVYGATQVVNLLLERAAQP